MQDGLIKNTCRLSGRARAFWEGTAQKSSSGAKDPQPLLRILEHRGPGTELPGPQRTTTSKSAHEVYHSPEHAGTISRFKAQASSELGAALRKCMSTEVCSGTRRSNLPACWRQPLRWSCGDICTDACRKPFASRAHDMAFFILRSCLHVGLG